MKYPIFYLRHFPNLFPFTYIKNSKVYKVGIIKLITKQALLKFKF